MKFSLIICSFNPEERILKRTLESCVNLTFEKNAFEILLVDNNSAKALANLPYINSLKNQHNNFICLSEPRQGLVHARLKGIREARAQTIVFVDDDNVLDKNYLTCLESLLNDHPQVGVWGPGIVNPFYIDGAPDWIKKQFGYLYQEKELQETKFGCEASWPYYYPAGSGMVVKKVVLEKYIHDFENGLLTSTGRKGQQLTSGEDSQIVWTAVKMNLSAGTSPSLKLQHIIPAKRTSKEYLQKLNYGIGFSFYQSLTEMFPETNQTLKKRTFKNRLGFLIRILKSSRFNPFLFTKKIAIEGAWQKAYDDFIRSRDK